MSRRLSSRQVPPARRNLSSSRPRKRTHRHRRGSLWLGLSKLVLACLLLWAAVGLFYYVLALRYDLRDIAKMPQRSVVYDAEGKFYSRFSGENRVVVPFSGVSEKFIKALLAREDTRFYQHLGVDPVGIARAAVRNLLMGGIRQGGSTITQQLARNSFPLGGRNLHRKLLEAALSFRIETELNKEDILECYVNRIYFGSGCYGVETAARTYFDKPAAALTLGEAALLAGLIRSPTRLSPLNNPEGALTQRNVVLQRLAELEWISPAEKQAAMAEPLRLSPRPQLGALQENWAMDSIRRELETILPRLGFDSGELRIYSTIQPDLQNAAEMAVRQRLESFEQRFPQLRQDPPLEAAAFFIDHRDGAVRAIVGGRDYQRSKYHRVYLGQRQAGSVVKSFVYALAWSRGLERRTPVENSRLQPGELPWEFSRYDPKNADGDYEGPRPAEEGLILSQNTMSVRVGQRAGWDTIARLFRQAGISENPQPFPSISLGAFETTLRDLVSAYTAFSTGGNQVRPYLIRKVVDSQGRVLYEHRQVRTPLLDPAAAELTALVLREVLVRGTGAGQADRRLRGRAGGKTGTTNDFQDAWFVGFYENLTGGVWVGFDTPTSMGHGAGGAQLALPIWSDIMISPAAQRTR